MMREERFQVGERARLDVEIRAGTVHVVAGESGVVRVSVEGPDVDEVEISQVGDTVIVREPSRWLGRSRRRRVVAEVPVDTDVEASCASADVDLGPGLDAVRVRTASGDVTAAGAARVDASTGSGDVRLGAIAGDVSVNTASGDVVVARTGGRLDVSTASGDVTVEEVAGTVEVGTASGAVAMGCCLGAGVSIKTLSGDIGLGLPSGIRVDPDLATVSGKVTLPPPRTDPLPASARSVRVRLQSMSGDIRIERAAPSP